MKRWIVTLGLGAVLGHLAASFLGPKMLTWYFTPPVTGWADCSPAVSWGMSRLILLQVGGLAGGLLLAALLGWKFFPSRTRVVIE